MIWTSKNNRAFTVQCPLVDLFKLCEASSLETPLLRISHLSIRTATSYFAGSGTTRRKSRHLTPFLHSLA